MSTPIRPRDGDDRSGDRDLAGSIPVQRVDSSRAAPEFAGSGEAPSARSTDDPHPHPVLPDRSSIVARQRERFGGVKIGSAFFGWLTATGMAVLLISLLAAAGVALGAATDTSIDQAAQDSPDNTATAQTVGLVGAIILLVVLFISYYCGGYVAGRMARFNGLRQGLAVCLWGLVMALLLAAIAAIAGTQYGVFAGLTLPSLPIAAGEGLVVGAIAIGAAVLSALIGALLGGLAGMRFHRKVDKAGLDPATR
jgi:hypothetical protein